MELKPELVLEAAETEEASAPLARFRALASELGIFLHVGSLRHQARRDARRQPLLSHRSGRRIAARYDKLHLRRRSCRWRELPRSDHARPGATAIVAELPLAAWGFRSATISASPPSTARSRSPAPSSSPSPPPSPSKPGGALARSDSAPARSRRARSCSPRPKAASTRTAVPPSASLIVSPWGEILAEGGEEPGVVFADIDLAASAEARARIPALKHGRDFEVAIAEPLPSSSRKEAS